MRDDEKKKVHENLKQEIRSLLISSPKTKYGGLSGSLLYFDYKQLNCGKEIPYAELGFHSFLSLLRSMPDVVKIEYKENSSSYRVHPVYDQSTAHIQKMVLEQNDKYEYQNRLYYQNWYSNDQIKKNFYNDLSYNDTHKNIQTNFCFLQKINNSSQRFYSEKYFISNKRKKETNFEEYLLLTPLTPIDNETINNDELNLLSYLTKKSNNNNETCSTPKTYLETPPNFSFEDYYLNESIQLNEKDLNEEINLHSSTNNQIENDPLLETSNNIISNEQAPILSSESIQNDLIDSLTNIENIIPTIINENELNLEISYLDEEKQINKELYKRLNNAICECINFHYEYRLCEIKFEYRHYPITNEILSIKSKLEQIAFNQYENQVKDFEKYQEINSKIDDQIYEMMFDQYIILKRNYYYMIKLINKR